MADVKVGVTPNMGEISPSATDKEKIDYLIKAYKSLQDAYVRSGKDIENALQTLDSGNILEIDANIVRVKNLTADSITTGSLIVGTNVAIGTAQTAGNVTTIIGNTVTTGYVNALSITAASVAAENITGTTISGKTINGGSVNMYGTDARVYIRGVGQAARADWCNISSNLYGSISYIDGGNFDISAYNCDLKLSAYTIWQDAVEQGFFGVYPVTRRPTVYLDAAATLADVIYRLNQTNAALVALGLFTL